jgi:hypothetical protein
MGYLSEKLTFLDNRRYDRILYDFRTPFHLRLKFGHPRKAGHPLEGFCQEAKHPFPRNTAKITLRAFWEVLATADAASPIEPPTR